MPLTSLTKQAPTLTIPEIEKSPGGRNRGTFKAACCEVLGRGFRRRGFEARGLGRCSGLVLGVRASRTNSEYQSGHGVILHRDVILEDLLQRLQNAGPSSSISEVSTTCPRYLKCPQAAVSVDVCLSGLVRLSCQESGCRNWSEPYGPGLSKGAGSRRAVQPTGSWNFAASRPTTSHLSCFEL